MQRLNPRQVRISTIIHATEDDGKVSEALSRLAPDEITLPRPSVTRSKGHHGNEIRMVKFVLPASRGSLFLKYLWNRMSSIDKTKILAVLEDYVDERFVLHLRIGKQASARGKVRIGEEDPIKIEIGFQDFHGSHQDNVEALKRLLSDFEN